MKKVFSFILTSMLLTATLSPVCAIDMNSTEITKIQGSVKVKKTSSPVFKKLNKNLKLSGSLKRLSGGDKVNTRIKSSADLVLKETCVLVVKEQSMFEVPTNLGSNGIQKLKAQQGSLLFKVIKGQNFQVQTADVIAGVKGTLFDVEVIDNLNSLLETPNLEIGTQALGGTVVNVYKGEVEVRNTRTGVVKTIKAGEGISAFGEALSKADQSLSQGFGLVRKLNPSIIVQEKYGQAGNALYQAAPILADMQEVSGLTYPSPIGDTTSRMNNLYSGLSAPVVTKLRQAEDISNRVGRIVNSTNELKSIGEGLLGKKFKPNFSRYRPQTRSFNVSARRNKELYLGNHSFVGVTAGFGAKNLSLEPTPEGIAIIDGFGGFNFKKYNGSKSVIEFQASHNETDQQIITTVNTSKGELYGRIPGSLEVFRIPKGLNSFVFDKATGRSSWVASKRGSILKETRNYKFKVDADLRNQKRKHDKTNSSKRKSALKKLMPRKSRNLLKGFGF